MSANPSLDFIAWKPEYECPVRLINCQHHEVLLFLNSWYVDLKLGRFDRKHLMGYLQRRFDFLAHYCESHLSFEDDVLVLLTRRYGFPEAEYLAHQRSHQEFKANFLANLRSQIDVFAKSGASYLTDTILIDVLKDVAGWWYAHIRAPRDGKPGGPDHVYRMHMAGMSGADMHAMMNDLLVMAEL